MDQDHVVLYRKYRPKTFSEVVGQEHIVRTIQNALRENKISHAYLFAGPRGTGKTSVARLLAKALNCERRESSKDKSEPCNTCERCREMLDGRSLDIIEIDAASNRGIDEIRNLKESVRFSATRGAWKVYLVDEVHMLTKEAFNAFLKTLEEPPANVVFVLATTEPYRLPATVVSRTQRFDFRRLSIEEIESALERIVKSEGATADKDTLRAITLEAEGSLRDAESLLGQLLVFGEKKINLATLEEVLGIVSHNHLKTFVDAVIAKDKTAALEWLQKTVDAGYDLHQLLHTLGHYLRRMLLIKLDEKLAQSIKKELDEKAFGTFQEQADKISPREITNLIERFSRARWELERYPLPQMAIEIALMDIFLAEKEKASRS